MSFQPTVPFGGVAGWRFLDRTAEKQRAAFEQGPQLAREIEYFKQNIGKIDSAEALVADHRLLKVALGAFGLEGEISKKFFIRKVLEEGTVDNKALANRMSDPAYRKLSAAFGFGDPSGSKTARSGFADKIAADYKTRQFEVAVGGVNDDMRLALNFRREIGDFAAKGEAGWFQILGSKPLRKVLETAFGLPSEFVRIDIDRQREVLRDKTRAAFDGGGIEVFKSSAVVDKVIDRFLARSQAMNGAAGGGRASAALALLQNASGSGSSGLFNLLSSQRRGA